MSDSERPHGQQPTRLPCPWDSLGKNTGVGCHFLLQCIKVKSESEVPQSCLTLSDPMDCSLPGSSVHGIFQARVLEWGAIAFSADELQSFLIIHCCSLTRSSKLLLQGFDRFFSSQECSSSRFLESLFPHFTLHHATENGALPQHFLVSYSASFFLFNTLVTS